MKEVERRLVTTRHWKGEGELGQGILHHRVSIINEKILHLSKEIVNVLTQRNYRYLK
jgi:hypothetical protein